jgi:hypothetical protein
MIICMVLSAGLSKANSQDRFRITQISGTIVLDGVIDEPAWDNIEPLPLVTHWPVFGKEPPKKTEILIAYDSDYLYLAGKMYVDDPSQIQATSKKRDFLGGNCDWIGLIIDSFNDNENGMGFFTSPSGLRLDATVFNDAQGDMPINISWNTFWDVVTKITGEGWFAEFRIPFTSLRFQDENGDVVMGLISWRYIAKTGEAYIFPAVSPRWGSWSPWKPSQAEDVEINGVYSRRSIYIAPYILGGKGFTYDLNDDETEYIQDKGETRELGLDLKYSVTNNITLDATLNTDFAQVEADDQQVNLTRFSLFFPEKRFFFQERSSNFDFNFDGQNRLFHSRKIGIHEKELVSIDGGVRLVGRVGQWDLGLLNMQTEKSSELSSENFGIARIRRRVFNENSYTGGILTSRIGRNGKYNTAYGIDGIFRVNDDDYVSLYWAQTFEDDKENNPVSLKPARIFARWERRKIEGLGLDLNYSRAGIDYDPGIGFEQRENYTRLGNRVLYGWLPGETSIMREHFVFVDGFCAWRNTDTSVESFEIGPGWEFTTKSLYTGNITAKIYFDEPDTFSLSDDVEVPEGKYDYFGVNAKFTNPMGRLFYYESNLYAGTYYDGWRLSVDVSPSWTVFPELELSGMYQINRISFTDRNQKLTAHIGRLRSTLTLTTSLAFSALIQYNSADYEMLTNVRLRYNPREGNDLYFVYNEGLNTNRFRDIPVLPYADNRAFLVKYTYTMH